MKIVPWICALLCGLALADYPQPDGLWRFDDPNHLTRSIFGADLTETGTHTAAAGMTAGDGAVEDPLGSYYTITHGIEANGGGSFVNQWTLLLDVKLPASSAGQWVTLFQTNPSNSNDGDCFISTTRTIGVTATGYTTNTITSETWNRIVVSVSNTNFYRIYVNGTQWLAGTVQALDGRFALDPTLLLFADENGDDNLIICTCAAIWGQALTADQISSLGGPSVPVDINTTDYVGINLLTNPSAEDEISGWTPAEGFDWQATDRTDWHFPHTGSHCFAPGQAVQGELSQTIHVDFLADEIDSGEAIAIANAYLGGKDQDQGQFIVEYLDIDDTLLYADSSEWTAGSDSGWDSVILPDADGLIIPSGTRSVRFRFLAQRLEGIECDVFGDDFCWEYKLAAAGNQDPGVPTVRSSSTSGTVDTDVAFMFASIDPEVNQVAYQIDWGNEITDWTVFKTSGANYICSHIWQASGSYSVRARAQDINGGLSEWSAPLVITISGDAVGVFLSQPYLQNVSQDAITIAWETSRVVYPKVDWGLTASYGSQTGGICINAGSGVYICKVRITGLSAQTQYHFRARNGSTLSADATFQTAPETQTPFTFAVWGDSQQETTNPAVSNAMFTDMAAAVDLGVAVGDIVQDSGYSYFTNPFRKYLCNILARQKPAFIAFGNHDEPESSFVHKAIQNSGMQSFSFNYGNAHFTCISYSQLNDYTLAYDGSISSLPLDWLQQDLSSDAAQNATWRFVFIHVPPYCERWFDGSPILRTYLVPLMNQYHVQICFSGHTHEYERGSLDGTYYVITGCTSYLDTVEVVVEDWPHMTIGGAHNIDSFIGGCVYGWTQIDIDGTELTLNQHAYNTDGTYYGIVDTVHIVQSDFTQDGTVDLEDFAELAFAWQTTEQNTGWNPDYDLAVRESKVIDLNDLAVFVQYWLLP